MAGAAVLVAGGLAVLPASVPASAALPGGNGRIAFANSGIGTVYPDGHGELSLTTDDADTAPAWSPDGARIAFASTSSGNFDVWVMNADGSGAVDLTGGSAAADTAPTWSPDGSHLAFQTDRDGNNEIYVMDELGGDQTNLTNDPGEDSLPAWSPDGDTIAFVSHRDGDDEVYTMDAADGSDQTDVTNDPDADRAPNWSPHGRSRRRPQPGVLTERAAHRVRARRGVVLDG